MCQISDCSSRKGFYINLISCANITLYFKCFYILDYRIADNYCSRSVFLCVICLIGTISDKVSLHISSSQTSWSVSNRLCNSILKWTLSSELFLFVFLGVINGSLLLFESSTFFPLSEFILRDCSFNKRSITLSFEANSLRRCSISFFNTSISSLLLCLFAEILKFSLALCIHLHLIILLICF